MIGRLQVSGSDYTGLCYLSYAKQIESIFTRASLDAASVASPGGQCTGPNPTDRGKLGSKRHLITDRGCIPLAFYVTGANHHDSVVFEELVDALPTIYDQDKRGRPPRWPEKLHADKAYDFGRLPGTPAKTWHQGAHRS